MVSRARVSLHIAAPERWRLGRAASTCFEFRHALGRALALQVAPSARSIFRAMLRFVACWCRRPRRLCWSCNSCAQSGVHSWPALRVRIGGVLGLAWWPRSLHEECSVRVGPDLVGAGASVAGVGAVGIRGGRRVGAGCGAAAAAPVSGGRFASGHRLEGDRAYTAFDQPRFLRNQHLEIVILIDAGARARYVRENWIGSATMPTSRRGWLSMPCRWTIKWVGDFRRSTVVGARAGGAALRP